MVLRVTSWLCVWFGSSREREREKGEGNGLGSLYERLLQERHPVDLLSSYNTDPLGEYPEAFYETFSMLCGCVLCAVTKHYFLFPIPVLRL